MHRHQHSDGPRHERHERHEHDCHEHHDGPRHEGHERPHHGDCLHERPRHEHREHDCHDHQEGPRDEGHCQPRNDYNGNVSIWGDPHVDGSVSNGSGTTTNIHFTTQGGAGKYIDLLDSESRNGQGDLHVDAKLQGNGSITTVGEEHIDVGGDDIDIKPGEVTVNGEKIQDGTHCLGNGNKITKQGNTTTIETSAGETLTVTNKGGYLDTNLKLNHYEGRLGGMLGDAINGHSDANTAHYLTNGDGKEAGGNHGEYDNGHGEYDNGHGGHDVPRRDEGWAIALLGALSAGLEAGGFNVAIFARFFAI